MSIEETTLTNMWEIAAVVEVLERKGLCTKQDLYDLITESRACVRAVSALTPEDTAHIRKGNGLRSAEGAPPL
jgi:hypothetical protein